MEQSLFLEGAIFSTVAVGGIGIVAWWLYLSPIHQQLKEVIATTPRLSRSLALLTSIGTILLSFGVYWDISEHNITDIVPGGSDFLWPPHLMMYSGFLIAFVVALGGLFALAAPNLRAGIRDPRRWVRRNPYVGAIVLAAGYGLFSIPGDAIWHELYGIDLTAWSPPHIFLAVAFAAVSISAVGLLLNKNDSQKSTVGWLNLVTLFFLVLALNNLLILGSIEWEVEGVSSFVAARPIWLYPVNIGVATFFVLSLARFVVPVPWTATITALFYFGFRIAASAFANILTGTSPRLTLVFILGAVLLDLAAQRSTRQGMQRALVEAAAFTAGFVVIALPTIQLVYLPYLTRFTIQDHLLTVLISFAVCALLQPAAQTVGGWLLGERTEKRQVRKMAPAMGD